jgi:hypothetical protein
VTLCDFLSQISKQNLKVRSPSEQTAQKSNSDVHQDAKYSMIPGEEENSHLLVEYNCDTVIVYFS